MVEPVNRCPLEDKVCQEELVSRLRKGDKQAGYTLLRCYQDPLWRFIYKQSRNYQDACDTFQETWQRFFEYVSNKDFVIEGRGVVAFLYKIASNIRKDDYRQGVVRQHVAGILARQNVSTSKENPVVEGAIGREGKENLALALSGLPEKQYQVVKLRYYDNLGFKEISSVLEAPLSTVHSWLVQAIENLRRMLTEGKKDGTEFNTKA